MFFRYVERLEESLRQNLVLADKMVFQEKEIARRRHEAQREEGELQPKLDVLRRDTKELKKQVKIRDIGIPFIYHLHTFHRHGY